METITSEGFEKVDLRVGKVMEVDDLPNAHKPAYVLKVDIGDEIGVKRTSARITALYSKEELIGKQVVCVVNFPPRQIGQIVSEVLVAGFYRDEDTVVLAVPDKPVKNGRKLL